MTAAAALLLGAAARADGGAVICVNSGGASCFQYGSHPATIYFGADGRFSYARLHWRHWGGRRTVGRGVRREIFGPAESAHIVTHRARLVARRLVECEGRPTYAELVVHSPGKPVRRFTGCALEF